MSWLLSGLSAGRRKRKKMGKGKELIGVIVSDKMQKTVIVKVLRTYKHKKIQPHNQDLQEIQGS